MARGSIQFKKNKRDKRGGRYYVVLALGPKRKWIRVDDPNTKEHAEKILAKHLNDLHAGEYRELKKNTFREFSERWLKDYAGDPNHCKPSTYRQYQNTFDTHLVPYFGDYALTEISPDMVQGFVSAQSRKGLAPRTILNRLAPMTRMFSHAVKWGYLKTSPMSQIEKPRLRKSEQKFLTGVQIRTLLETVPDEYRAFFTTAALTGMRLGELLAMRWKHLDWKNRHYKVRERLYRGQFDTPKSETSAREVDLSLKVIEALKAHRAEQNKMKLMLGPDYEDNDLIFCGLDGKPMARATKLRTVFKDALTKAEIPTCRLHDLRHSCAAVLIAEGAHPKYIQTQLGHASITITMDTYGHLMREVGQAIVQRVDAHVFGT